MINSHSFLACQVQAVTEFAVSHHNEDELRELLDSLLGACARIEHAIAWRKVHGGDAA
jgi:hypothetical protein